MSAPRCPVHDVALMVEDVEHDYGQVLWLCPMDDCREDAHEGPADEAIYREEAVHA